MKKGLSSIQLKVIAIIAMSIDHIAWGFVDMFSPLGQIMHVIGRLTIPIMCFFVAVGYEKTKNLKGYILRMLTYSVLAVVPFYLFFGEEYGYRQNFIFDLLLALLALTAVDSPKLKKPVKAILLVLIVGVSAVIGGWPVFPILLVLLFHYVKDFKKLSYYFCGLVILLEAVLIPLILLNNVYHFSHYEWEWYEYLYFFGFVLALPLIRLYNGERGKYPLGNRYFFFVYYPAHFFVLWCIDCLINGRVQTAYIAVHILCLFLGIICTIRFALSKLCKPVIPATLMSACGVTYMFGFLMEICGTNIDFMFAGVCVQYFGECLLFVAFLWFVDIFCRKHLKRWVYTLAGGLSISIITLVCTSKNNHFFYNEMYIDYSGPFPRLGLDYGFGFDLFFVYMCVFYAVIMWMCFSALKKSKGVERKRIWFFIAAFISPMLVFIIKMTGITGGYEIIAIGVLLSIELLSKAFFNYGYFDSVNAAGESVLQDLGEGVLVMDSSYRITYCNKRIREIFKGIAEGLNAREIRSLTGVISTDKMVLKRNGKTYETRIKELAEQDNLHGYMLTVQDMTEHYEYMRSLEREARQDALTKVYNRHYFRELTENYLGNGGAGCFMMIDIDDFKSVNDTLGHDMGDRVLMILGKILNEKTKESGDMAGRIGGDEFTVFFKGMTEKKEIKAIGESIILEFKKTLSAKIPECKTSVSVGAAVVNKGEFSGTNREFFTAVYKRADKIMYTIKQNGKSGIMVE